jgi:hypothetical protein
MASAGPIGGGGGMPDMAGLAGMMGKYFYMCIYVSKCLNIDLNVYVLIYMYICRCVCLCTYLFVCMYNKSA